MSTFNLAETKEFFLKNEQKIVLIIGLCLISAISFEFGVLQGQKWQQKPIIIEKPINTPLEGVTAQGEAPSGPSNASAAILPVKSQTNAPAGTPSLQAETSCLYVGSKSSTKFYLATCSWAKRIKPENVVCFKSAEQAVGQGRTESKCAAAK